MARMTMDEIDNSLSEEELKQLDVAAKKKPIFDDDSPEMTLDMLKQFKRMNRTKQTASIHLSPKAQSFCKAYGKGYISFLSRLIDAALDDEELVKKCI